MKRSMTSSSSSNIMGDEPFKKSCLTFPKKTRRTFSTRNTSGISCARSYRTLRDDSFRGTLFQALRARLQSVLSLRDALADISQQHLVSGLKAWGGTAAKLLTNTA